MCGGCGVCVGSGMCVLSAMCVRVGGYCVVMS